MWRLLIVGSALLISSRAIAQDPIWIGKTATATNTVSGKLGSTERGLKVGDGVYHNEEIKTGLASRAQFIFRDETAFTLGPNSVAVLDKFVYDPKRGSGELSVRALTGSFRFVSGSSPKENYRIVTPGGIIGVRGTIVEIEVIGLTTKLTLREGAADLCSGSNCTRLSRPGTYTISRPSGPGSAQGTTTPPQNVGDANAGCGACNPTITYSEPPALVTTFISDIISNPTLPATQTPQSGATSLPPNHAPRGAGFFGPRR